MGGRSANRGQCAQQCRLPYDLVCDNEVRDLKDRKYLLSPSDLAALDLVPELIAAGVNALKIEGRMKSPQYVASATRQYRLAIDEGLAGRRVSPPPEQLLELESPFSRGLSQGWLAGRNLQIVDGRNSANRGICIGKVTAVRGDRVAVELTAPLRRGDGVAFPSILGEAHDQGGRVYEIFDRKQSVKEVAGGRVNWPSARDALDLDRLQPGQELWKTDDPQIDRRLRKTFANGRAQRRVPLDLTVEAAVGRKLRVSVRAGTGATCRVESEQELDEAQRHPLTAEVLREQFGRLGTSVYELRGLEVADRRPADGPFERAGTVAARDDPPVGCRGRGSAEAAAAARGRELPSSRIGFQPVSIETPVWHVLCRELKQVEEVLALGVKSIVGDFAELQRCAPAVRMAREKGAEIFLATPRIQKPGEEAHFARIADARPDGLLVRNLGGAAFCAQRQIPFVADMSLNAVNQWTVAWLHELGARRVTAAYDSDRRRLSELADAAPLGRIGSGRLPAPSLVPHGTLRFRHRGRWSANEGGEAHAGGRRPPDTAPRGAVQFRLHEARGAIARPHGRGASLAVGCLLPQHALSCPAAESHRPRAGTAAARRAALPHRAAGRRAEKANSPRAAWECVVRIAGDLDISRG